jgi:hypothetical protein
MIGDFLRQTEGLKCCGLSNLEITKGHRRSSAYEYTTRAVAFEYIPTAVRRKALRIRTLVDGKAAGGKAPAAR